MYTDGFSLYCVLKRDVNNVKTDWSRQCAVSPCWPVSVPALPSTCSNSNVARAALIICRVSLQIDTVYFHPVCYRWRALCSRWFERLCVCDLGTLVVESRVRNGADRPVGLARTSAGIFLRFYQARGEDSLGLLGFSGVWVSLSALCKTKPTIPCDLYLFYTISFSDLEHIWLFHRRQHFAA